MSWSPAEIETVVREVLARIAQLGDDATAPSTKLAPPAEPATPPPLPAPQSPQRADDVLTVRDRVVTLAALEGRRPSIRRVVVPQGAVVTPAVKDYLREEGLSLEVALPPKEKNGKDNGAGLKLAVITMGTPFDPAPLLAMLLSEGLAVTDSNKDCLIESVGELASAVSSGEALGLLLTRHVPAALCLANRREGVRAVAAETPEAVEKAARSVGANVLVVDPRKVGGLSRTMMNVRAFVGGGIRACPDVFAAVLR